MAADENLTVRSRRPYIYLGLGCLVALAIVITAGFMAYFAFVPRVLLTPLVLALPDCKAGVYMKPPSKPVDLVDDVGNDAAKRACDSTKGFQGEAVLARGSLKLKIHNPDSSPLVDVQVHLVLKPRHAGTYDREYKLEGRIPPFSDGELETTSNLDPRTLQSFSASVTWVYFEG